jgi:hypothetical protein
MRHVQKAMLAAVLGLLPALAMAQWIGYPSAGVQRQADGSVDMQAAAPRLPSGKPDLSGIWISDVTPAGEPTPSDVFTLPSSRHMANLGADMPDGLPYQDWLKPIVKQRTDNLAIDDPHIRCLPDNFLRAYGLPHMLKFVHKDDLLLVLNEMNAGYRQVFIDGRALPDTPTPSWQGYSAANWSRDTLVIDTIGVRNDTWIDWNGSVLTEQGKVREEMTRLDYGHLEIKVTVDDPGAYTKPWSVTLRQRLVVDAELIDEVCLENERFVEHMKLEY